MTWLIALILCAALVFFGYRIWTSGTPVKYRLILIFFRTTLFALLLIALLEPTFTCSRLVPYSKSIVMLIDLSESMQSFPSDSSVRLLRDAVRNGKNNIAIFGFGDSLRKLDARYQPRFNDRRSMLFGALPKELEEAESVILVSDGNISYSSGMRRILERKEVKYVPLQLQFRKPSCFIEFPDGSQYKPAPGTRQLTGIVRGYNPGRAEIIVRCNQHTGTGTIPMTSQRLVSDSGLFALPFRIALPANISGSLLFSVSASLSDSGLRQTRYCVLHLLPDTLLYSVYSPQPSLDKRFIVSALDRNPRFSSARQTERSRSPHLLVLSAWDSAAYKLSNSYPDATQLFLACSPKPTSHFPVKSWWKPIVSSKGKMILGEGLPDLPPLTSILTHKEPFFKYSQVLMAYDTSSKKTGNIDKRESTIPLVYTFKNGKREAAILAGAGFWQWDLYESTAEKSFGGKHFLDYIVSFTEGLIQRNLNQKFVAFPDPSPVYSGDSISFTLLPPSTLDPGLLCSVVCKIWKTKDTLYSRNETAIWPADAPKTYKFPPMQEGTYPYSFTLATQTDTFQFQDSVRVENFTGELEDMDQNVTVLGELGIPLTESYEAAFKKTFSDSKEGSQFTTRTTIFTLARTGLLLIVIIFLFGLEWILRRLWNIP